MLRPDLVLGWAWLCKNEDGSLEVCSTPNQDNPLMPNSGCGNTPVLGLDVWEHVHIICITKTEDQTMCLRFQVSIGIK